MIFQTPLVVSEGATLSPFRATRARGPFLALVTPTATHAHPFRRNGQLLRWSVESAYCFARDDDTKTSHQSHERIAGNNSQHTMCLSYITTLDDPRQVRVGSHSMTAAVVVGVVDQIASQIKQARVASHRSAAADTANTFPSIQTTHTHTHTHSLSLYLSQPKRQLSDGQRPGGHAALRRIAVPGAPSGARVPRGAARRARGFDAAAYDGARCCRR